MGSTTATTVAQGGSFLANILPLVVLFGIFYFLVIRPEQKRVKKHREMLESLKKGDKIVTNGGLIAEIVRVEKDFFKIKLDDKVEARLDKESIVRKLDDED
jgi:preprotein translocase subunit YajC